MPISAALIVKWEVSPSLSQRFTQGTAQVPPTTFSQRRWLFLPMPSFLLSSSLDATRKSFFNKNPAEIQTVQGQACIYFSGPSAVDGCFCQTQLSKCSARKYPRCYFQTQWAPAYICDFSHYDDIRMETRGQGLGDSRQLSCHCSFTAFLRARS